MSEFPSTSELCNYESITDAYAATSTTSYPTTIIDDFFAFIQDIISKIFGSESWEAGD